MKYLGNVNRTSYLVLLTINSIPQFRLDTDSYHHSSLSAERAWLRDPSAGREMLGIVFRGCGV
jgi:hypothetical protein